MAEVEEVIMEFVEVMELMEVEVEVLEEVEVMVNNLIKVDHIKVQAVTMAKEVTVMALQIYL